MRLGRAVWIIFKWCLITLVLTLCAPVVVHGGWVFGRDPRYFIQSAVLGLLFGAGIGTWRARRRGAARLPLAALVGAMLAVPIATIASQGIALGALFVFNPSRAMTDLPARPERPLVAEGRPKAKFPLKVSADGRYLEDSSGRPFYFVGDTHWPLFWHYSLRDAQRIIDDRAAKGFTAMLVSVAPFRNKANADGHRAFRDLATLAVDEEYFAHADRVLEYAADKGLAVYAVALWWANYHEDVEAEELGVYGRWLGRRWKDRDNLIWVIGGDERFRRSDLSRFRALAEGIRAGGARQIMSFHPFGGLPWWSSGHSSSEYLSDEPWLDFSSVQAHTFGGRMVDRVLRDYDRRPTQPVILIEPWYFGTRLRDRALGFPIHQPALRIRQALYQARIGGGSFGEGYGAWPFWYHASSQAEWREALDNQPAAVQIATHMRRLFESLEWWRLAPDRDGSVLVGGGGWRWLWNRAVAAGGSDRSFAVVYVPTHRKVEIRLDWFSGPVVARWYDPTNGRFSRAGAYQNDSVRRFEPPPKNDADDSDFILVLETQE